jgi:hypothetical protein
LLNVKVTRNREPGVGGDQVAGAQPNDVAWNQLPTWQFAPIAVAQNRGRWRDSFPQSLDGSLRTKRLREVDSGSQQDNDDDDPGADRLTNNSRYDGRADQHEGQRIAEKQKDLQENWSGVNRRGLIRAKFQ